MRDFFVFRFSDRRDHAVDRVERDREAFQNMRALFRLAEIKLRAPRDDLLAVLEIFNENVAQGQKVAARCRSRARSY